MTKLFIIIVALTPMYLRFDNAPIIILCNTKVNLNVRHKKKYCDDFRIEYEGEWNGMIGVWLHCTLHQLSVLIILNI